MAGVAPIWQKHCPAAQNQKSRMRKPKEAVTKAASRMIPVKNKNNCTSQAGAIEQFWVRVKRKGLCCPVNKVEEIMTPASSP
jgi:hypothetical protein